MSVENTFARWKGRFRKFLKRVDLTVNSITAVIAASCIIHNICELRRDNFLTEWLVGVGDTEDPPTNNLSSGLQVERDASDIRDVFSQYLLTAEGRHIGTGGE